MDSGTQDEIEDLSSSSPPPPMGSMQITGNNNGFVHNIDFMAQTYLRNRSSAQIDIQEDTFSSIKDRPLPIFLKVFDEMREWIFVIIC